MENPIKWHLVNPEGVAKGESFTVNRHPDTLEGKTVLFRWNGKHNGDIFLNRIAKLLTEKIKDVKIIKNWEAAPETASMSWNPQRSKEFTKELAGLKPDISIGAQAD